MDLQQWPKSLPSRGTFELDVLQLPLSKVPWIANDGSICIGGKQMAPNAAGLMTASVTAAAQTSMVTEAIAYEDDTDKPASGVTASAAANSGQQADVDASSDDRLSMSDDDRIEGAMMGAAGSAVQSAPV